MEKDSKTLHYAANASQLARRSREYAASRVCSQFEIVVQSLAIYLIELAAYSRDLASRDLASRDLASHALMYRFSCAI